MPSFLLLRKGCFCQSSRWAPKENVYSSGHCACVQNEDKLGMGELGQRFKEPSNRESRGRQKMGQVTFLVTVLSL